jgi:hypothetical protein
MGRRAYRTLDERELLATRQSDTVFIFGSGRSLLEISGEEWKQIAGCQTIAFGEFHRERLVRVDYHMINEVKDPPSYTRSIRENPCYEQTVFVVQGGWVAHRGNEVIGGRMLPAGAQVFRYRRVARERYAPPSDSFGAGLVHAWNSSVDAANLALLMGWKRIVFAGVDLFDRQYFYLPPGESTPNPDPSWGAFSRFNGADELVELFRQWRALVESRGVELLVYNPSSLLAESLDVFRWPGP